MNGSCERSEDLCGVIQILAGYQKAYQVDLFYSDTGQPYDLTGAAQVHAIHPGQGAVLALIEFLTAVSNATTATTTSGSNQLTTLAAVPPGLSLGMQITGTGIPQGTTVLALNAGVITMSQNATASATLVAVTFASGMVVAPTGNTTSSSNQVTGISNTGGLQPGQTVTGTGIPAGTTLIALNGTTATLSANATATNSAVTLTFTTPPQVTVVGAPGSGRLQVGIPAVDSALIQPNPNPTQFQDLQIAVTNALGGVDAFRLPLVLDVVVPPYGVV